MSDIKIRQANMNDTQAIAALFQAQVPVWQRLDEQGRVEEPPYEKLTVYERWLHGGSWMSIETAAIHLSHLICGAGFPVVAEDDGNIVGYIEGYQGDEPTPYGNHLHIAHITGSNAIKNTLMMHMVETVEKVTVAFSAYDSDSAAFYGQYGMQQMALVKSYTIPAKAGQGFYKATEHLKSNSEKINGWYMPIGRLQSSRQQWETLWPPLWNAIPEIISQTTHRLQFSASGQDAFVCCQQQLYTPRTIDVYCWSPKPLSQQLLTAISDWAYRQEYRSLSLAIPESTVTLLGGKFEETPYQQAVFATSDE